MNVTLKGSSPATMAAGILLLARGRMLGPRTHVAIVGDPKEIGVVTGPALLHSAPLASCGVGRDLGNGAMIIVPGPANEPLAMSLSPNGAGGWFFVDREGPGIHPATRAFSALRKDNRVRARWLAQQLQKAFDALGCATEPAILDILFSAPVPPLTRLAVALRAGRAITGERGLPVTAVLVGDVDENQEITLEAASQRLTPAAREGVLAFARTAEQLASEDGGSTRPLIDGLAEILCHLALLPPHAILPPLDPAMDAVAWGVSRALSATSGNEQAQVSLMATYQFMGGTFVPDAAHPVELPGDPPPPPSERLARWKWFCTHVSEAANSVDRIWRNLMDPVQ